MRLNQLTLEDWGCHERLELDLSQGLQIEGRNGTGKSSILEAIRFIFAESARGYNNRIRNGQRSATVSLTFEQDGKNYLIEKKLYIDKASTAIMSCDGIQVADNPSSAYERMQQILPEDILDKLLYIPQSGLTSILEKLSGKDGKLEMDRLFGLDRLERVWEKTGEEIKHEQTRVEVLDDEMKKHPQDAENEYCKRIKESEEKQKKLRESSQELDEKLKKTAAELAVAATKSEQIQKTKKEKDSVEKRANQLRIDEASTAKELESTLKRVEEIRGQKKILEKLETERNSLAKYEKLTEALRRLKENEDAAKNVGDVGDRKKELEKLAKEAEGKKTLEREYVDARQNAEDTDKKYAQTSAEIRHHAEHYKQLTSLEGEPRCSQCGQKLNQYVLEREQKDTALRISALNEQVNALEQAVKQSKKTVKDSEEKLNKIREVEARMKHLAEEILEKSKKLKKITDDRATIDNELKKTGHTGETLQEAEKRNQDLMKLTGRIESVRKEVIALAELERKQGTLAEKYSKTKDELRTLSQKLSELRYSEDEDRKVSAEKDRLTKEKYELDSELKTLANEMKLTQQQMKQATDELKKYANLKAEHDNTQKHIRLLSAAREVFHRDKGLARYLRENSIIKLNKLLTNHFKRFNQNPRYVDVSFDKDYQLIVRTTMGQLSAQQLSGGELAQLALALRIALIDLMSPIRLLILDEPFGSLDETHRELLGEALNKIAAQGQLIIVTHINVDSLQLVNRVDLGGY